jgi:uncharacterized sporulation protein YeaH/YhbH (DUF444 family)
MSTIVDRRKSGKNKSVGNRQKFIKRYKDRIKHKVEGLTNGKGITDVLNDRQVVVNDIDEPNFNFDLTTGERDIILPGNKHLQKGDKISRPPQGDGEERGTEGEDGLDEFRFTLTKEEFLDLYFSDMELPKFIKESLKGSTKVKWKRTGYSKDGIPPRLDLVKTLKQAMARRLATGSERYLDDIDLRYKHFTKQQFPVRQATMILLMDVSYSMEEFEKSLAKKFFLLLYLFLHKVYKQVEVRFVSHTVEAQEVTEHEFFYSQNAGGTVVSSGLQKVQEIINELDLTTTNVYVAQASDGDSWPGDEPDIIAAMEDILTKVQYFAYIQTEEIARREYKAKVGSDDLFDTYEELMERFQNLQIQYINYESDVYPVLRKLFERE